MEFLVELHRPIITSHLTWDVLDSSRKIHEGILKSRQHATDWAHT